MSEKKKNFLERALERNREAAAHESPSDGGDRVVGREMGEGHGDHRRRQGTGIDSRRNRGRSA